MLSSLAHNARCIYQELIQLYHICNIQDVCMLVVGGLGRAMQYPKSDLDIVFIYINNIDTQKNIKAIELFIQKSWDLKWHISAQVLSNEEFLNYIKNWECATAFLDAKCMCGPRQLFFKIKYDFNKWLKIERLNFITIKRQELMHRHLNFPLFALEPNCKEHAGSLRDFDYMHWICKILGIPNKPFYLQHYLGMTKAELKEQRKQFKFLSHLRYSLHILTHKKEDILRFEYQNALAQNMGYTNDESKLAQEYLMRTYFRATRTIDSLRKQFDYVVQHYLNQKNTSKRNIELSKITKASSALTSAAINKSANKIYQHNYFKYYITENLKENCVQVLHEDTFIHNPNNILDCFYLLNTYDNLSILTQRALFKAKYCLNDSWRNNIHNIQQFLAIIYSENAVKILNSMHQHSILGRYLIFFRNIVGQMQHDLLHVYTVDQHTLKVLEHLYAFQKIDYTYQSEYISQISQKFKPYWVLYIAALFHDLGKGQGGNHSKIGAEYMDIFCQKHNFSRFYRKTLVWLVLHHLLLSHSAQNLDAHNMQHIINFCKQLNIYMPRHNAIHQRFKVKLNANYNYSNNNKSNKKNKEKNIFLLNALYLLTVADIQGTNPNAYNSWRATLIQKFFTACMHYLNAQKHISHINNLSPQLIKQDIMQKLQNYPQINMHNWLNTLQSTFFMRHKVEHIMHITKFLARCNYDTQKNNVFIYTSKNIQANIWHIWIHAQDVQYLFVHICKVLAKYHINIIHADLDHTNYQYALNYIQVDCTYYLSKYNASIDALKDTLKQNILAEINQKTVKQIPLHQLKHHSYYSARVRQFIMQSKVSILYNTQRCILQIKSIDHIGLLYKVALILAKKNINIQQAHIITIGEHVEDVFVIQHPCLKDNNEVLNLEVAILNTINENNLANNINI